MPKTHSPMDCPKCHRIDNVSKVSAILQGGTHQINGQIPMPTTYDSDGWSTGTSYKSYHATQQSSLASRLTPPSKPSLGVDWLFGLFLATVIFFGPQVCMSLFAFAPSSWADKPITFLSRILIFVAGFAMAVFPVGAFFLWQKNKKTKDAKDLEKIKLWERSIRRWEQLYYCSRDDCIFVPGENSAFPISEMLQVINSRFP